jgi:hypothetical protein
VNFSGIRATAWINAWRDWRRLSTLFSPISNKSLRDFLKCSINLAPRVKLDFPKFNGGEDPTSWLCRAEYETPPVYQVALASFHLEGEAQLWYQLLQ